MTDALDEVEARRAERKAKLAADARERRAVDLAAVDALEVEYGDSNVATIEVPYSPGLVTLAAVRVPKPAEVKRYRSRIKPDSKGRPGDPVAAAEELASVCRVYPDDAAYEALCEARAGIHVQLGVAAIQLAAGRADDDLKG